VLRAIQGQERPPDELVGVDTGSRDGSAELVRRAGGRVVRWTGFYDPGAVLNAGIADCRGDLVMVCSSHSVLVDPATLADLESRFEDPRVSAASLAWDDHPEPGARIDAAALRRVGLRPGSYFSNSMGMLRRDAWMRRPFTTGWPRAAEDYRWAVEEILDGGVVERVQHAYRWLRPPKPWGEAYRVAWLAFWVARRYDLPLHWKGAGGSLRSLRRALLRFVQSGGRDRRSRRNVVVHSARIAASLRLALGADAARTPLRSKVRQSEAR
jgi:glycosyltransferase involved in cell wall biosynthesis